MSLTVADTVDQNEWHLPTYDPGNGAKYHYKLHSLDIYFWTQQDALQFVNGVRRVLPPSQVEVIDEPTPPTAQQPGMSAVVQKLENAAITDPQYLHRNDSVTSATQNGTSASSAGGLSMDSLPPPPPLPQQQQQQSRNANFAPMAYNPAAPSAPEAIVHREKTPPPDEDPLNPLAVAVAYDYQKQPFTPAYPPQSQFPLGVSSPGLPPNNLASPPMSPPQFAGPPQPAPPQPGIQRSQTMPVQSGLASPGLPNTHGSNSAVPAAAAFAAPPTAPAPVEPSPPLSSPGLPPPPVGGYSNYTYGSPPAASHGGMDYAIHQQVYRPTEGEVMGSNYKQMNKKEPRGKLEENAARLERGMTGMFKKFEKKFG